MIKFFYELPEGTKFHFLGDEYIKTALTLQDEKSFNAVLLKTEEGVYLWSQKVLIKE